MRSKQIVWRVAVLLSQAAMAQSGTVPSAARFAVGEAREVESVPVPSRDERRAGLRETLQARHKLSEPHAEADRKSLSPEERARLRQQLRQQESSDLRTR